MNDVAAISEYWVV